jgi:hypothetical protein
MPKLIGDDVVVFENILNDIFKNPILVDRAKDTGFSDIFRDDDVYD